MTPIVDPEEQRHHFVQRSGVVFAMILLGLALLVGRMFQLQLVEHDKYRTRSENNRIQMLPIAPVRGQIFDRNGLLLADNVPVFSLSIVRERVVDLDALLADLQTLVGLSGEEIESFRKRRARRPFEAVPLRVKLTEAEIARVSVNQYRLPGVKIEAQLVRSYPYGAVMAHAVGSVRRMTESDLQRLDPVEYAATEYVGKRGVEAVYESALHGSVGHRWAEIDARGTVRRTLDTEEAVRGQSLTLHLDARLQIDASAALGSRRGAVVAIEPSSGGILALVSNPGYDPDLFVTGMDSATYAELTGSSARPLFNRAIHGQYAPGSTLKPFVGLAGLHYGATTWDRIIVDTGAFRIPGQSRLYRDWSWKADGSGGQGEVHLAKAIYRSSNVYFYTLAYELGVERLGPFLAQFGFGSNIAVDIPDARSGLLPSPEEKYARTGLPWYPGDSVNLGIGQGAMLATPLQVATAATVLANRGRRVRPRMLLASSEPLADHDPPPPLPPISGVSAEDMERMVSAMEDVVHRQSGYRENGTAWAYIGRDIRYRMAGKSGTAQVVEIAQGEEYDEDELPEHLRKHAWFMAFAPAEAPRIAVAVLVENGGGGSSVAAPVARAVIDAYLLPTLMASADPVVSAP